MQGTGSSSWATQMTRRFFRYPTPFCITKRCLEAFKEEAFIAFGWGGRRAEKLGLALLTVLKGGDEHPHICGRCPAVPLCSFATRTRWSYNVQISGYWVSWPTGACVHSLMCPG